ncbi:MAG TPA: TRAP transporter large permease subunit [Roseomonas sp.]|nr:TRAP transporter large permease subunit [Roseomonas sp.]
MSTLTLASILMLVLCGLLASGLWIGMSLAVVGFLAIALAHSQPGMFLATAFWEATGSWTLAALPLFVWMGEILFRTRLSEEVFNGIAPWVRRVPGGLLHVNIFACGLFGSVSGSSAATCATVSKIAVPELKRRGFDEDVALGSLATSGTLGILIPPSIIMVVYAVAADVSIIRVFISGFIPALIVMALFSLYIAVWALLNPNAQPPRPGEMPFMAKLRASSQLIPCVLLIIAVIGSMFVGIATATEAAACGVLGSLVLAVATRSLTWASFWESVLGATRTSSMVLFILAGAGLLTKAMALTGIPAALAQAAVGLDLGPYGLIAMLTVIYVLLGMALDGVSMIVLTTSIVVPIVKAAGFDLIWFGVFVVLLVEIAQVTPPVGFNLFVMQALTGRSQGRIARASFPFFMMLLVTVAIITVFPPITAWLPNLLLGG